MSELFASVVSSVVVVVHKKTMGLFYRVISGWGGLLSHYTPICGSAVVWIIVPLSGCDIRPK